MKYKKWIWMSIAVVLITALVVTVVGINQWYNSGNVRVLGKRVRVDLMGTGYMFNHETGAYLGTTMMTLNGKSVKSEPEVLDGRMNIFDYVNEYDGTLTTVMGVMEGEDGYWEICVNETCRHLETDESGSSKVVDHSCKYSYTFYVHPDKQDFLVARVKDKYAVYPIYIVMANSQEEATQIYHEFASGKY